MSRFQRNLVLSGIVGLLASACLAGISAWLVTFEVLSPPFPYQLIELAMVLVLGGFSLAEIPLMLFVLRRLSSERADSDRVVMLLNALYVLFAAVYGAPVSLLTGSVAWTLALSALSIIRFAASLLFVRQPAP